LISDEESNKKLDYKNTFITSKYNRRRDNHPDTQRKQDTDLSQCLRNTFFQSEIPLNSHFIPFKNQFNLRKTPGRSIKKHSLQAI
jgi:hypothetical protein